MKGSDFDIIRLKGLNLQNTSSSFRRFEEVKTGEVGKIWIPCYFDLRQTQKSLLVFVTFNSLRPGGDERGMCAGTLNVPPTPTYNQIWEGG